MQNYTILPYLDSLSVKQKKVSDPIIIKIVIWQEIHTNSVCILYDWSGIHFSDICIKNEKLEYFI